MVTGKEPPNDPLTLEELREMDGEPVWVANLSAKKKDGFCNEWALIENYGDYWLAYRRKPEKGAYDVV